MIYLFVLLLFLKTVFIFVERFIYTGTIRSFEIIVIVAFFLILLIGIIYVFFDLLRRENDEKGRLLDNQIIEFEKKRYKK